MKNNHTKIGTIQHFVVWHGITDKHISQLIAYAHADPIVQRFTSDKKRFASLDAYNTWKKQGREIYTLTENGELVGVIWFGEKAVPKVTLIEPVPNIEKYGLTFAIRLYEKARGKHLSKAFTTIALRDFMKSEVYRKIKNTGMWLGTAADNTAAIASFEALGYRQVSRADKDGKILLLASIKPIIFFDIDRTLINTDALSQRHEAAMLHLLKISSEKYAEIRAEYMSSLAHPHDYSPTDLLSMISKKLGVEKSHLRRAYYNPTLFSESLYADTKSVLETFAKQYVLGVYSQGRLRTQTKKLSLSGIAHFFAPEYRFILRRKMKPIAVKKLPIGAIVVDDTLEAIEWLLANTQTRPIWVNRKGEKHHTAAETISTLSDLVNLVKSA